MSWAKLIAIAFLTNGVSAFGLRVLKGMDADAFTQWYLALWYGGAVLFLLGVCVISRTLPKRAEWVIGGMMGLCSALGTLAQAKAMSHGVEGAVAFPVGTGGALILVILAGVFVFKERIGRLGMLGIVCGIAAQVLFLLG